MATETLKSIARQFFEAQDRLRGGPDPALCAPSYTAHLASFPPLDRDGKEQFAKGFYAAFPDLRHEIEDIMAKDDRAVVRWTLHGTHQGSFMGIGATGRTVHIPCLALLRIQDGRVVELHGQFDAVGLLQQLGAMPGPDRG